MWNALMCFVGAESFSTSLEHLLGIFPLSLAQGWHEFDENIKNVFLDRIIKLLFFQLNNCPHSCVSAVNLYILRNAKGKRRENKLAVH